VLWADASGYDPSQQTFSAGAALPESVQNATVATNLTVCKSGASQHWVMGPFHSYGGMDWWQFRLDLEDRLGFSSDDARYISEWAITAHNASGHVLGLPPIHHHHSEFGMNCMNRKADAHGPPGDILTMPFANTQGDQGCPDQLDGTPCLVHNVRSKGAVQPVWKKGAEAASIWNDVRPAGSPTLTFWYQFRFSLVSKAKVASEGLEPLSFLELKSPSQASGALATNPVVNSADSFAFYTNTWKISGTLYTSPTLTRYHTHQSMHQITWLIEASPEEIGLGNYSSASKCDSILTNSTGFDSNKALMAHLTSYCPRCFSLTAPDSKLICRARSSVAEYNHSNYDRNSKLDCRAPHIRLEANVTYTNLAFWAPHTLSSTGGMVSEGGSKYPEHSIWMLKYVADRSSLNASEPSQQVRYDEVHEEFVYAANANNTNCRYATENHHSTYSCTAPLFTVARP
jgi:hypothetical protein